MAVSYKKTLSIQDYIATQGILSVSAALVFLLLHWWIPAYSTRLLQQWYQLCEISPTVQMLWQRLLAWFV